MGTFCFIAFYVIFGEKQKRLTMSGPLIMSSMDSLINSICVICLFRIGNKLYYHLCSFCDVGLKKVTIYIATKLLITKQSIPKQSFSSIQRDQIEMNQNEKQIELEVIDEFKMPEMIKPTLKQKLSANNPSKKFNKEYKVVLIDENGKIQNEQKEDIADKPRLPSFQAISHSAPVPRRKEEKKININSPKLRHSPSNSLMFYHSLYS